MSNTILACALTFFVGFFIGAQTMLNTWEASAQRGAFEVGQVLYKAERITP